jgi:hypothetical protein
LWLSYGDAAPCLGLAWASGCSTIW